VRFHLTRFKPSQESSDSDASEVDLENKQDWEYKDEEPEEPPTLKDLDFLNDSESQDAVNPVVEYAQIDKAIGESEDELPPLLVKRRRPQDVAHSPPPLRLRSCVDGPGSSSGSSSASGPAIPEESQVSTFNVPGHALAPSAACTRSMGSLVRQGDV
jgi:hypothetical protein